MPLVEIEHLTIAFAGREAVSELSLTIGRGDRFGIIGESGSGKSLTALSIAGLLPETATARGSVRFDGADLPTDELTMARLRGRRMGMVFQEPMTALNPLMTIGEQIAESVRFSGTDSPQIELPSLLTEVGLLPVHAQRYPHQLSGGQRQRAMIAMALAGNADLLIADEPTSALDTITQRKVLDLIAEICQRRRMTLLFISHDIRAVRALCTRVAVMQGGRLVECGDAEAVLSTPQADYTRRLLEASRIERRPRAHMPAGAQPLLSIDNVSRDYRQDGLFGWWQPPTRAVDNASFSVGAGECVALVGPSGCGKTTLARMVVGLDRVSSGQMVLDGVTYHGKDLPARLRADMSLVFQDPFGSFDPRMTIGESIGEPLHLLGQRAPMERQARLVEAVTAVGLDAGMLERYPHEFSGGQRQRLAIARALVTRPRLLVLDEPVSALDMSVRGEVLRLLSRLQAEHGLTYLIISHDLDMVAAMADRVLVMEAGRIVEEGPPERLFAEPQHQLTQALVAARLPDAA